MRRFFKIAILSALALFVGVPLAFVAFVLLMVAFGIGMGILGAIFGLMLTVLKFALIIVLPIAIVYWLVTKALAPARTY